MDYYEDDDDDDEDDDYMPDPETGQFIDSQNIIAGPEYP